MATKVNTMRLQGGGRIESFEIEHAERIVRMRNNGGWHIADDEKVEFTKNGFRPKKNNR